MDRRSILYLIGIGATNLTAGCASRLGSDDPCPDLQIETALQYDELNVHAISESKPDIVLVRSRDELTKLGRRLFGQEEWQWVNETDFDQAALVGVHVPLENPVKPDEPTFVVAEQDPDGTIHTYICIADTIHDAGDVGSSYATLLRVYYDGPRPPAASVSIWEEGEKTVLSTRDADK